MLLAESPLLVQKLIQLFELGPQVLPIAGASWRRGLEEGEARFFLQHLDSTRL